MIKTFSQYFENKNLKEPNITYPYYVDTIIRELQNLDIKPEKVTINLIGAMTGFDGNHLEIAYDYVKGYIRKYGIKLIYN